MAEEEPKEPESGGEKKSKLGLIIGILVGIIVLVGGVVAGVIIGPKVMGSPPEAQASGQAPVATAPPVPENLPPPLKVVSSKFDPIIIDLRGERGEIHHLKIGLAAELRDSITEDDFRLVRPRGREAALAYLRTLRFKDVTNPKKYKKIKKELAKRVMKAVGRERVHRVLLIDFVAQ